MIYAVYLAFDEESSKKIKQKMVELVKSSINPFMVINRIPPHIAISFFETENDSELLDAVSGVSAKLTPSRIRIQSVDAFASEVVYYAPVRNDFLYELNRSITEALLEIHIKPDRLYTPEYWVPHIALAVQLTSVELHRALEIAKEDFESFDVFIERLALAECDPYKVIAEYSLISKI